jgi:acyl-CoA synthetase (AMP-forming)/AMP-acid ligase II
MELNLADLFELVADEVPARLALVAGDRRLTYEQLDRRANRVAHHLLDAGLRPGETVAVYSWNRAEWLEVMIGAYKARLVPVNVNYRYVASEVRHILEDSDAAALVHEMSFSPLVSEARSQLPSLRHVLVLEDGAGLPGSASEAGRAAEDTSYETALSAARDSRGFPPRSPDDLYILYTGGTTGVPKGVLWRQEDIFYAAMGGGSFASPISRPEELASRVAAESERSICMVTPPMMHGGAQWMSFITLFAGGTVLLYTGHHYDPHEIWSIVERERATSVMVVGDAMARPLAEAAEAGRYDLSSLKSVGSGGAILSVAVKEQLRSRLPGTVVMDSFGASETGAAGSVLDMDGPAAGPRFTVGPATAVLGEDLRPVVPGSGQVGRLAKRGHIPLGYHKDPEKTASTFPTDPDGTRWVVPGDLATVEPNGTIVLLGRGSVSINSGGEKVFPEEVEAALKSHPDVFDAVVVGLPDERLVERVTALVRPRDGAAPSLSGLADHARAKIAAYKAPREIHLVEALVRTPAGKPDYRWARAEAERLSAAKETGGDAGG